MNEEQKAAVIHGEGPLLIIAGAGTGKTKVITHRIAYLIASKVAKPEEMLALTFTEKAASEMEERVDLLVPYGYSYVDISTFNSFGEKILRNTIHEMGYFLDFKLLDDVEQAIFFREHLFQFPLKYYRPLSLPTKHVQELLSAIKRLKQEDIRPEEYLDYAKDLEKKAKDAVELEQAQKHLEMAQVYREYQALLVKEGKIDFEDQVVLTVKLFKERPSVHKEFQQRYKYILVDEFQDTNYIQFELLKLLCREHQNLTVVGDDDQSIFRFRGASLSNIRSFRTIYPHAKKVVLVKNYRSTQNILDSSYRLIQHNNPDRLELQEKVDKRLESTITHKGKSIHMLQLDTLSHEADKVAEIILEKTKEGYNFKDLAILVRRNADADPFLRALNMKEIPFRFSGSRGLYAQEEVKILVSFIRALTDLEDSKSLFHLSLSDAYGMDPYDLTKLSNFATKKHLPLHRVFKMLSAGQSPADLSAPSEAKVKKIFGDLLFFSQLAGTQNAGRVLYSFLERSGFLKDLVEKGGLPGEIKIKNIRIFFDKVKNFSELSEDDSMFSFAEHLDLLQQVGDNPASAEAELEEDAVNVLTVHKAKGLEFPIVFMVSLIADRFPGRQRREKIPVPDELLNEELPERENYLQEERRLFYVGMTRAEKLLYLVWSKDYGLKRPKKVSPFVLEALDLPQSPEETLRTSSLEEIKRYASRFTQNIPLTKVKEEGSLTLSFFRVDDYLTCPLKYKYRQVMRIPVLPHHNLVYGRVLHNTIHFYLKHRMSGRTINEEELIKEYFEHWINEGFLSREHEEMRKKDGEKALRLFYHRQESSGRNPLYLEKEFRWQHNHVKFTGRWDRIDLLNKGGVIIDYKATGVKDQKEANKRAKESLQMDLYALSFAKTQDLPLVEIQLYFLESDIVGHAEKGQKERDRAMAKIEAAEAGIRQEDYRAKPDWHNCNFCDFKTICPDSYAY
ncbi:MAG: ATP-dependent helicase [Candidatus Aminicenantes bacterium]|nr:ATP-dependent helicase [Candidatus Aminicenantes bacterium]